MRYFMSILIMQSSLLGIEREKERERDRETESCLSSWCMVIVVWLFLAVPWVCLQFEIAVFSDHIHLLFTVNR